jgi:hypothetical protein
MPPHNTSLLGLIRASKRKRLVRDAKVFELLSWQIGQMANQIRRKFTESSEATVGNTSKKGSKMAKKEKLIPANTGTEPHDPDRVISLTRSLSRGLSFQKFSVWIVGDTPLITHAWSQKAKLEMLQKQVKATKGGKEIRDPQADFVSSLYEMGGGGDGKIFGFPATGVKNSIISAGHKDKGIPRTQVMGALWIDADMVRVRPALAGAICDMPLIRIYGSPPEQREDMVKIGSGLNKVANLAYRGQFTIWAMKITGNYNKNILTDEALAFLIEESGRSSGLGEWRNERKGMFGAYHLATREEEIAWEAYANGTGPLPITYQVRMAAE